MKILFLFQRNLPKQEKVLANLVVVDANTSKEEGVFSIISMTKPELSFENETSEKEFQRIFSKQYILLFPEVICSHGDEFVVTSKYVSSIFPGLMKEYLKNKVK